MTFEFYSERNGWLPVCWTDWLCHQSRTTLKNCMGLAEERNDFYTGGHEFTRL